MMRTKILLLVVLCAFTFSCKDDDDQNNNEEEALFTPINYVYEGDLRLFYLESENVRLNDSITAWEEISPNDPDYDEAQGNIEEANAEIAQNEGEANTIADPANAFAIINPTFPPIPVPSPCLCFHLYNSFDNIVFQTGNDQGGIVITSVEDETVLINTYNNQIYNIPNTDGLGTYQSFGFSETGFTGEALISVQTDTGSYSILANFINLE